MIPDITSALNARMGAWADQHGVPFFIENISEEKPPGTYLEAFDLPAAPRTLDLGMTCHIYTGIYQVNVVIPVGVGTSQGRYLARQVAGQFPEGGSITGDGFTCYVSAQPGIYAGVLDPRKTRYSIPVSIPYRVDITR